jgi:phosphoribosylformylglycinamidine synthase
MVKVGVKVMPREVILDTQGRAVEQILRQQKMHVGQCRVGRFVELDFPTESREEALKEAKAIAEKVLHNPLIETFELNVMN